MKSLICKEILSRNLYWDEVADWITAYLRFIDKSCIWQILEKSEKIVFDKNSTLDNIGKEGLLIMN